MSALENSRPVAPARAAGQAPGSTHGYAPSLELPPAHRDLGFWGTLREDLAGHENDWTRPGFRALAVHRFGVWRMGIRSKLLRAPLSMLYRFLFRVYRNRCGIELPFSAYIGRRVVFEHQFGIVIHGSSIIGDGCIIRQGVTLGNRYLDRPYDAPILGKRVNVGAGAVVLGRIQIGDGANIGANAVVLDDVPAGVTVVGIPARPVPSISPQSAASELPWRVASDRP